MTANNVKISVIIAAYNAEKTLRESVESVLSQSHNDLEILIVDDQSKDETLALAKTLAADDGRIKVLACPQNGGPARARNLALDHVTGDWIAIVDSDDVIMPDRFRKMLDVATKNHVEIVFDNLFYHTPRDGKEYLYIPQDIDVFGDLPLATFITSHRKSSPIPNLGFLKPLIRSDLIVKEGLRYDPELKIGEDAMLIMDLLAKGAKATLIPEASYRYNRHDGSISAVQSTDSVETITSGYHDFLKRYKGTLPQEAVTAMSVLIDDNNNRITVGRITDRLANGCILKACAELLCRPSYIFPVAKSVAGRIRRALRRG